MKRCVNAVKLVMTVMLSAFLFLSAQDLGLIHAAEKKIVLIKQDTRESYDTIQAAINAVAAGETGTIEIPAGTYGESLKISNTSSRTIFLRGAQANVSAYSNGKARSNEETILTGGIEVNGLLGDDSLEINGLTLHGKGINIVGWGAPIKSSGAIRIVNNVITDIADQSTSAIHINCGYDETIQTVEIKNNYINNIGEDGYATNGVYSTLPVTTMYITGNYIGNVNHSTIQLGSMTVNGLLSITENHILNWNKDGTTGTGAQGSQGDGIYLPKGNTPEAAAITVNQNYIVRENGLSGSAGYAARCNFNKGTIDLSANYWNETYPYRVISGGTYANVTIKSVCDEYMNVTDQSIGDFRFSISTLYNSGSDKEKMLSATIVMLDKDIEKPVVQWSSSDERIISVEQRKDAAYYVAKNSGVARISGKLTDPKSGVVYSQEVEGKVIDIDLKSVVMEPASQKQLQISVVPEGEKIPYNKIEWSSSDERIVEVDSNGCLKSKDKKGSAEVTVTMYGYGTKLYAQKTITVTVDRPIPVQEIKMQKDLLMKKGDTYTLQAEILPSDADQQQITWTSSDESVAVVQADGSITAVANGTSTITATIDHVTASCNVSVYEVKEPHIKPLDPAKPSNESQAGIADANSQDIIANTVDGILSDIAEGREIAAEVLDEVTRNAVLQAMNEGKAITLTANANVRREEEIDPGDLHIIQAYLSNIAAAQHTALQYLDFSFHLVSDDGVLLGEIKQLKQPISYAIILPQGTAQQDTSYYMVRLHDGKITKLPLHANADGTLTFSTDQFSVYALVAEKKADASKDPGEQPEQPTNKPEGEKQPNTQPEQPATDLKQPSSSHEKTEASVKKKSDAVSTADMQNEALWLSVAAVAILLMALVLRKKHRKGMEK